MMAVATFEMYQWKQEDPADTLANFLTYNYSYLQLSYSERGFQDPTPQKSSPFVARGIINTLWFLSLALFLLSTLVSIVVRQWCDIPSLPEGRPTRYPARLPRFFQNKLRRWLPSMISFLPLSMQVALALLIVGLVLPLHPSNHCATYQLKS